MKVHLTTAYPTKWSNLARFEKLAQSDKMRRHHLVADADQADFILFVDWRPEHNDWRMKAIHRHPLFRRLRRKCFLYSENDQPWGGMPGLFTSMPREDFDARRMRACPYAWLWNDMSAAQASESQSDSSAPDLLFSFIGSSQTYPLRHKIVATTHERAFIQDTAGISFFGTSKNPEEKEAQKKKYAEVMNRSKFVLCPRGHGPTSYRLYETLAIGRVPVIIGDAWVPPRGPQWDRFTIQIPEARIDDLTRVLEKREGEWESLAAAATENYAQWFAPDVIYDTLMENCADLLRGGQSHKRRIIDRRYWRLALRHAKSSAKSRLKR